MLSLNSLFDTHTSVRIWHFGRTADNNKTVKFRSCCPSFDQFIYAHTDAYIVSSKTMSHFHPALMRSLTQITMVHATCAASLHTGAASSLENPNRRYTVIDRIP